MRLLADREIGGINVRLFWDETAPEGADIVLEYEDLKEGTSFTLHPPRDRALDAFYHPNAYAWLEWSQRDGVAQSAA
ncbi:MAG TPA: hypothetical protein VHH55_04395 [Gaiellaceae bacterium]|jgi:hypothetical protein|nr:hypothetical protein [Gaiellaceae bacterium]